MQFPILTKEQQQKLAQDFAFERWGTFDEKSDIVRFCTSWATRSESVATLCAAIDKL